MSQSTGLVATKSTPLSHDYDFEDVSAGATTLELFRHHSTGRSHLNIVTEGQPEQSYITKLQADTIHPTMKTNQLSWDEVRPTFTKLYIGNGMKLKDVMELLARNYNFVAPLHMFKKHIARWSLVKSFTKEEKAKFAALAQTFLGRGQSLPSKDDFGRTIPWDRVKRQVGAKVIPYHAMFRTVYSQESAYITDKFLGNSADTFGQTSGRTKDTAREQIDAHTLNRESPQKKIHLPPMTPITYESIEVAFSHIKDFYQWHTVYSSKSAEDLDGFQLLSPIYIKAFLELSSDSAECETAVLLTAGQAVAPILRSRKLETLGDILSVLFAGKRLLTEPQVRILVRFLAAVCREELGRYHPLSALLSHLCPAFTYANGLVNPHRSLRDDIVTIEMLKCTANFAHVTQDQFCCRLGWMQFSWMQITHTLVRNPKHNLVLRQAMHAANRNGQLCKTLDVRCSQKLRSRRRIGFYTTKH